MKRRIAAHPGTSKELLPSTGIGGEQPGGPTHSKPGPNPPIQIPIPNPAAGVQAALSKLTSDITAGFDAATRDFLGGGEVLVGIALIIGGLLVATGQAGRVAKGGARAGLFAATRGAVR